MIGRNQPQGGLKWVVGLGVLVGLIFLLTQRSPALTPRPTAPAPAYPPLYSTPSAPPAPTPTLLPTLLLIPALGVSAPIIEAYLRSPAWDVSHLGAAVGHLHGTAALGTTGNSVLAGHVELRDGRRGVFADLAQLPVGAALLVTQGELTWHYRVSRVERVAPDDLSVAYPSSSPQLTLITCEAYDFLLNSYQQRVVVVAEQV